MIRINGEDKPFEEPITLLSYLEQEGYQIDRIAVEKNGEIIPKSCYKETVLHSGDVLEIVSFVGGG
nr:sulfur carrier protein ThiS [uncultured Sellimonas sp.]